MRYWYLSLGGIFTAVVLATLVVAFTLSQSLLFYWYLIPADTYDVVIGVSGSNIPPEVPLEAIKAQLMTPTAQEIVFGTQQFLYARSSNREVLVRRIPLREGLITVESVSGTYMPTVKDFLRAGRDTAIDAVTGRIPQSNPSIMISAASNAFYANRNPISIVAESTTKGFEFSYIDSQNFDFSSLNTDAGDALRVSNNGDLFVAIPRELQDVIPGSLKVSIQTRGLGNLGLTSSKINIFSDTTGLERVAIASSGLADTGTDTFALGIQGEKSNNIFESWIAAEYGKHHPVTQSFILPDGTRGFEVVPVADSNQLFVQLANPNCRSAGVNSHSLFVCTSGDWSTISRSEEAANNLLTKVQALSPETVIVLLPSGTYLSEGRGVQIVGTTKQGVGKIAPAPKQN